MRLHRFFIEERIKPHGGAGGRVVIEDAGILHQWRDVLRLKAGNEVILFDGFGSDYSCELASLSQREAVCLVRTATATAPEPTPRIHLFAALIKKDHFEWLLEKATELGISQIRPVIADRSEVRRFNLRRAKEIIREEAEQSGRGTLPALYGPMQLQNVFTEYQYLSSIAFDPHGEGFPRERWQREEKVGVFIGPEGGWSARELEVFHDKKIPVYSLGAPTLRSETAAVVAAALLLF